MKVLVALVMLLILEGCAADRAMLARRPTKGQPLTARKKPPSWQERETSHDHRIACSLMADEK
jgi:hypothetical protein